MSFRLCKKRRTEYDHATSSVAHNQKINLATKPTPVLVICRGFRFETTTATLFRLGPCYLSMQADIETAEPIYLDFSSAAFHVLLDALTVAQLSLGKALLLISQKRRLVADLEALLQFVALGWVLGTPLSLPPEPAAKTPRGDKFGEFRQGFNLRSAYQGESSGVFNYLVKHSAILEIPCQYDTCQSPSVLLQDLEEYGQAAIRPRLGCIPISIEMDSFMIGKRNGGELSEELFEWCSSHRRVSSLWMLQVAPESDSFEDFGDFIRMHAGGAAVFDLGPRCALICEGLVFGMNRTASNRPGAHKDMLTVDVLSDIDNNPVVERLACQPLEFEDDLITYFRLSFPLEAQTLGRIFRFRVDPFHPKTADYVMHDDLAPPLYMLRSVELFGILVELPSGICPLKPSRAPFAFDEITTRIHPIVRHRIGGDQWSRLF